MVQSAVHHRELVWQLIQREISGRYKGSVLGIAWSFFQPLLMLAVYTFVFSVVLKTTWRGEATGGTANFAIILFSGLIIHTLFAESLNRAPSLILANTNLVKRVVFPLEILPVVMVGVSLFNFLVGILILLGAMLLSGQDISLSAFYIVLVIAPLLFVTLGVTWALAAVGVYLRDLGHVVVVLTTMLLFLSPVFYSTSAVPEKVRALIYLNPLTFIIEQARTVLIWGGTPSWLGLFFYALCSLFFAWGGFALFQWTRKGFSDVL